MCKNGKHLNILLVEDHMMAKPRDIAMILVPALLLAGIDQLIKWLIRRALGPLDVIMVLEGIFHLTRVENTGSLFGLFPGQQLPLIILSIVVISVITYLVLSDKLPDERLVKVCVVLLLAGALGNFIDRIVRGAVFDFMDFQIWPVFNLADAMISGGVVALLFRELRISFKRD